MGKIAQTHNINFYVNALKDKDNEILILSDIVLFS